MPALHLRAGGPADGPTLSRLGRGLLRLLRGLALLTLLFVGLAATVPLLLPIPALTGSQSAASIAAEDPDAGRFVDIEGLSIYVEERAPAAVTEAQATARQRPPLLLLHGFLTSTQTWRQLLVPLGRGGRVVAFDRPAFGLSARPLPAAGDDDFAEGDDPYSPEAQVAQTLALVDTLGIDRPILVGSSSGGALALRVALTRPERVQALVLIAPALASGGAPRWLRALLDTPQLRRIGPLLTRGVRDRVDEFIADAWHDPSLVDRTLRDGYSRGLRVDDWDHSLWRHTLAYRSADDLLPRLAELELPVLVITGDDDRVVDPAASERLLSALSRADAELVTIGECGHLPQEECPAQTLAAIEGFVDRRADDDAADVDRTR